MFNHLKFIWTYPKIGPDMYLTHWLLFFKPFRIFFQNRKIKNIAKTADIRPYCTILGTDNVVIGERVIVPSYTLLSNYPGNNESIITLEDDVLLGPNVSIYSSTHKFMNPKIPIKDQGYECASVLVKSGAWLGINVVVMPGVTIGKNSVIGANSVVTKDIPDYTVAVGAPARVIKNII
jgi:acetyltransferase-like isoleucine patch superfamily enzyme